MNLTELAARWRERTAREDRHRAAREASLRARLPPAVRVLVERFGARRVVLFGSLAEGRTHSRSDIDLAVEGIASERQLQAWGEAEAALGSGVTLDLVRIEAAGSRLKRRIEAGEELFPHGDR